MLTLEYIDADELLAEKIVKIPDYPLSITDDLMRIIESNLAQFIADKDKCVISISDDMFLSDGMYKNFKKSLKILIKTAQNEEINAKIQDLLEKYCDVVIDDKELDFENIFKLIKK